MSRASFLLTARKRLYVRSMARRMPVRCDASTRSRQGKLSYLRGACLASSLQTRLHGSFSPGEFYRRTKPWCKRKRWLAACTYSYDIHGWLLGCMQARGPWCECECAVLKCSVLFRACQFERFGAVVNSAVACRDPCSDTCMGVCGARYSARRASRTTKLASCVCGGASSLGSLLMCGVLGALQACRATEEFIHELIPSEHLAASRPDIARAAHRRADPRTR